MDAAQFWHWLGMPAEAEAAAAPRAVSRAAAELMGYESGAPGLGPSELRYVLNAFNRRNTEEAAAALLERYGETQAGGGRLVPRERYDALRQWLETPEDRRRRRPRRWPRRRRTPRRTPRRSAARRRPRASSLTRATAASPSGGSTR